MLQYRDILNIELGISFSRERLKYSRDIKSKDWTCSKKDGAVGSSGKSGSEASPWIAEIPSGSVNKRSITLHVRGNVNPHRATGRADEKRRTLRTDPPPLHGRVIDRGNDFYDKTESIRSRSRIAVFVLGQLSRVYLLARKSRACEASGAAHEREDLCSSPR